MRGTEERSKIHSKTYRSLLALITTNQPQHRSGPSQNGATSSVEGDVSFDDWIFELIVTTDN